MKIMFIDPATYNTGWALFEDGKLLKSGAIIVDGHLCDRMLELKNRYAALAAELKPDKFYIERMNQSVFIVIWSVAVIVLGMAEGGVRFDKQAEIQISPNSWQQTVRWKQTDSMLEYRGIVKSIDELAAIGMGLHYYAKMDPNLRGGVVK